MVLSKWALFFSSSSCALFVLDLVWTLVWLEKIKCSRGAGRYGGGTARRGAAWTFNFFMKTVPGFVSCVSFVLDLVWALRHGSKQKLKIHAAWPRGSIPAAWIFNFFNYYIWYSTSVYTVLYRRLYRRLYSTVQYCINNCIVSDIVIEKIKNSRGWNRTTWVGRVNF